MTNTSTFVPVSPWVQNQFPLVNQTTGPNFIAFIKAYYEWMEQPNNVINQIKSLKDYRDLDKTPDAFLSHFQNQLMTDLPGNLLVDKRLLMKHIINLYQTKGTKRGFALLFRILFNEDIEIFLPGEHLLKPSDNQWIQNGYIEVNNNSFLSQLVGNLIYTASGKATALVENYNVVNINNKLVNVLSLSNITGNFLYGDLVLSQQILSLNVNNAPLITGSLSAVSITQGGAYFNLGDVVNISGSGSGALGRVSSVVASNGKLQYNLINGGYGFTVNAQVQITGGGGTGGTFTVGAITNEIAYPVNLDIVNTYYNTPLDIASEGFTLGISNTLGVFNGTEIVNAAANGVGLDFAYITGNALIINETLSNASLGIAGLQVISVDNPSFVNLTGVDTQLMNANLKSGISLIGGTSGDIIYVNYVYPKVQYIANGTISAVNSTSMTVITANGYFLPTSTVKGQTSGANAYINSTTRNTNWLFPSGSNTNLDTSLFNVLTYQTLIIGKISKLSQENPGNSYSSNATATILEPLIFQLQINDGQGGVWGGDANVSATAINANGIITSIQIIDSGYGFQPDEALNIFSNNLIVASGTAIVDGTGVSHGYYKNNKGFLSDTNFIQDSYYWQNYSYEINSSRMFNTYQQVVNMVMHPVGFAMFGKYDIEDSVNSAVTLISG